MPSPAVRAKIVSVEEGLHRIFRYISMVEWEESTATKIVMISYVKVFRQITRPLMLQYDDNVMVITCIVQDSKLILPALVTQYTHFSLNMKTNNNGYLSGIPFLPPPPLLPPISKNLWK